MPDYRALAEFRYQLRRFLHVSEERVRAAGLEPQQQQLLLAVKGAPPDTCMTIAWLAERMSLRHHSVVGLADRLEAKGFLRRNKDPLDHRRVLIELTPRGESVLEDLTKFHEDELQHLAPDLIEALRGVLQSPAAARERRAG
ncbi:MAG TPA: MarR family transcriptional regulator [Dehalococcoidia bacterium]|jgi:DNA-binding MarR family transcriptional regulator|nr:MarR family transcriptional regulator [Dehalococcoidia bacterium]